VICDSDHFDEREKYLLNGDAGHELIKTLLTIAPLVNRSSKARVAATLALQRLLMHSDFSDYLKLNQSPTGEWCLQSLRSSSRDVRIAATQTLRPFILAHPRLDPSVVRSNRIIALDFLQTLWMRNEVTTQETVVLALTMIARVVGDEEMNIILVRLVDYLAHGNPYINGLVYAELQNLAEALHMSMITLLSPYWRTIGVVIIKNLQSRPAIAQQICDWLAH
jgi:serine/threonine-protein kinase ATR